MVNLILAHYGTAQNNIDVLEILKGMDLANIHASNRVFGDPAPNLAKTLEIEYSVDEVAYHKSITEGDYGTLYEVDHTPEHLARCANVKYYIAKHLEKNLDLSSIYKIFVPDQVLDWEWKTLYGEALQEEVIRRNIL